MTIDEPAAAIAAARCLTARSIAGKRGPWTEQHPRECSWCDLPTEQLATWVRGWLEWSGAKDKDGGVVYERIDAQRFAELARRHPDQAEALIVAAQGLVDATPTRGGQIPSTSEKNEDRVAATFPVDRVQKLEPGASEPTDEDLAAWS